MSTFLVILHILVCFVVVLVVLLQTGKGADIGASFGGGSSNTLFGSRGSATFMTKVTAVAGAIFMITSLGLGILSSRGTSSSVIHEEPAKKAMPGQMPGGTHGGAPFNPAPPSPSAPAPAKPAPAMPPQGK